MLLNDERRIFDRFHARFPAKFKETRGDFGDEMFLRDACANGANILSRERLSLNELIALEVELPDGHAPLVLSGRVIWNKPTSESYMWDIGLQFDEVVFMKMWRILKYNKGDHYVS